MATTALLSLAQVRLLTREAYGKNKFKEAVAYAAGQPSNFSWKALLNPPKTGAEWSQVGHTPEYLAWKESWERLDRLAIPGVHIEWMPKQFFGAHYELPRKLLVDGFSAFLALCDELEGQSRQSLESEVPGEASVDDRGQSVRAALISLPSVRFDELTEAARMVWHTLSRVDDAVDQSDPQDRAARCLKVLRKQVRTRESRATEDVRDLCRALDFLADSLVNSPRDVHLQGRTLREVQIPGLGTKWLENNLKLVELALGFDPTAGRDERPRRVQLRYLDPQHLARPNARAIDVYLRGQDHPLEYEPSVVVVCENLESMERFPALPGGIALFGNGKEALALMGAADFIGSAAQLLYWGDIDEDGLSILSSVRASYPHVRSLAMDLDTLIEFQRFGTSIDVDGKLIEVHNLRPSHLTESEQRAFDAVTAQPAQGHRRLEQERIPADYVRAQAKAAITH